jgi:uncharacterized protein YbjQ (UPF0145 family)
VSKELDEARHQLDQGNYRRAVSKLWMAQPKARTDPDEAHAFAEIADQITQQSSGRVQSDAKHLHDWSQATITELLTPEGAPPPPRFRVGMPVSTSNDIPGWEIKDYIGEVFGLVVRSGGGFTQAGANFKSWFGGELKTMTNLLREARLDAIKRLVEEAEERGADGIVAMRFDVTSMGDTAAWTEICAYGTAVHAKKLDGASNTVVEQEG